MKVIVYGISTCGTVKKARKWLDENGISYQWVDFRKTPVEASRVATWMDTFGFKPMRNTSGGSYRALGPEKKTWGTAEWLPAMQADPMLLKRPVVEVDGKPRAVGFEPHTYTGIFGA